MLRKLDRRRYTHEIVGRTQRSGSAEGVELLRRLFPGRVRLVVGGTPQKSCRFVGLNGAVTHAV